MDLECTSWQDVSDDNLENMIVQTLQEERETLVTLLIQLSIVFRRNLYAFRGYTSLNEYLMERFSMTRQQAFMRAAIARIVHEHPGLLDMLKQGETCLSHLATIAPRLTPANSPILYNAAATMTKRELEAFVPRVACDGTIAEGGKTVTLTIRCPAECADMLDEVQALISVNHGGVNQGEVLMRALAFYLEKNHPEQKARRAQKRVEKKACDAEKTLDKLEQGWDMNRGHPQALAVMRRRLEEEAMADENNIVSVSGMADEDSIANVSSMADEELTEDREGRKGTSCMMSPIRSVREAIPQSVKHRVWLRDHGQCSFVSEDGHRCGARHYLQLDHVKMVCQGGTNEEHNLRLLCATHNRLESSLKMAPPVASWEAGHDPWRVTR